MHMRMLRGLTLGVIGPLVCSIASARVQLVSSYRLPKEAVPED